MPWPRPYARTRACSRPAREQGLRKPLGQKNAFRGPRKRKGMMLGWRRQEFVSTYRSLPSRLRILSSIDELADFRSLPVQVCEVLLAQFLVGLELFLSFVLFAHVHVGLAKTIVRVRQIGIYFESTLVLGNCNKIFVLIRIEIAELQVGVGEGRIEGVGFLQQGVDLRHVQTRILRALPFPE